MQDKYIAGPYLVLAMHATNPPVSLYQVTLLTGDFQSGGTQVLELRKHTPEKSESAIV